VHRPALDVDHGEGPTECHVVDTGPGGLIGLQLATVLGHPPEPDRTRGAYSADAVRAALRHWDRPDRLARSALASGRTPAERVASVRAVVGAAVASAFGNSPAEQQLREVAIAGVIERDKPHEVVAASLHLSRSTYFRLRRAACDRLVEYLSS
jgi:hypothetical protein